MELTRGLLDLFRMADNRRTAAKHQLTVIGALPNLTGYPDALFGPDLIAVVFEKEGING